MARVSMASRANGAPRRLCAQSRYVVSCLSVHRLSDEVRTRLTESVVYTQDELEEALRSLNRGDPVRLTAAGRTDKGVHASGQVIDFKLPWWQHGHVSMMRALNARLPKDVSVVHAEEVDSHFHSRYSASYRRYAYHIYNAPHRSPLFSRYAWHVPEKLSVERMQAAANMLLGTHDFSTFGSAPDGSGHCIREIVSIRVDRTPAPDAGPNPFGSKASSAAVSAFAGVVPSTTCFTAPSPPNRQGLPEHWARDSSIISIDIVGRSFLYHMVRNIVGALKAVGCGKDSEQGMRHRLQRRSRDACGVPAPAHGLTLTEVGFWGEDGGLSFDGAIPVLPHTSPLRCLRDCSPAPASPRMQSSLSLSLLRLSCSFACCSLVCPLLDTWSSYALTSWSDWVASRPQEDVFGQRLTLGPPKPSPG
jgi:tRNA pseudouridine38-40 synthase